MLVGRGGVDDPLRTAGRLRRVNIRGRAGGRKQKACFRTISQRSIPPSSRRLGSYLSPT